MTALLVVLLLSQAPTEAGVEEPLKVDVISLEVDSWRASGFQLLKGSTALTIERALGPHLSIAGGLVAENYEAELAYSLSGANMTWSRRTGMNAGIRALARWYPQGGAPFGFWLGAMAAAGMARSTLTVDLNGTERQVSLDVRLFTSGALIGYSGVLAFDVVFQVSGGFRADFGAGTGADLFGQGSPKLGWVLVSPIACLGIGWAF